MPLYSRKEFRKEYDLTSGNLSNMISRGTVVEEYEGFLSTDNYKNQKWITKRLEKLSGETKNNPEIVERKTPPKKKQPAKQEKVKKALSVKQMTVKPRKELEPVDQDFEYSGIGSQIQRQKDLIDLKNKELSAELTQLKIDKEMGKLIPVDLVMDILKIFHQSVMTEYKNSTDNVLTIFTKRKDYSNEEVAEIRGSLVFSINEAGDKSIKTAKKTMEGVVEDYSNKKGVGQRNIS